MGYKSVFQVRVDIVHMVPPETFREPGQTLVWTVATNDEPDIVRAIDDILRMRFGIGGLNNVSSPTNKANS